MPSFTASASSHNPDLVEWHFQPEVRRYFRLLGILCCVVFPPLGIYVLWRMRSCRVALAPDGIAARGVFSSFTIKFADVRRIGSLVVSIDGHRPRWLAEMRVGGREALHLCFLTNAGKTKKFMVSMYQDSAQIMSEVGQRANLSLETVTAGLVRLKWDPAK